MASLTLILPGIIGASVMMGVLYVVQRWTSDAGIVDAGWSAGIGLMAVWYGIAGGGALYLRVAMMLVAVLWSFRLASFIVRDRLFKGHEDGRYSALRTQWGDHAQRNFFLFFQAQAFLVVLFSLPLLAVAQANPRDSVLSAVLGVLWGWGSILGESIADWQLSHWRRNPENAGKTCCMGLWRWSRHPNYFFEWLHWWAYVWMTLGTTGVWIALIGPILMLAFLYRITGIPYTEKQALKSRGDNYLEYQRSTSAFFPWPPKKKY